MKSRVTENYFVIISHYGETCTYNKYNKTRKNNKKKNIAKIDLNEMKISCLNPFVGFVRFK